MKVAGRVEYSLLGVVVALIVVLVAVFFLRLVDPL